jgi:hypothetical protein
MALGNRKFGSVFIGGGSGDSVVRSCALPSYILGKCGKCGTQKHCEKLVLGPDTLSGEFHCDCGTHVKLSVSLGFQKTGGF